MSRDVARNLILLGGAIHVGAALFHVALPWISGWFLVLWILGLAAAALGVASVKAFRSSRCATA